MFNRTLLAPRRNRTTTDDEPCEIPSEAAIVTARRYLVPILVFVGIIGNSLILIVLNSRRRMKTKTNILLSFMAWSDLVHALGTFLFQLPLYQEYVDLRDVYPGMQIPLLTVVRFSGMSSNWFGVSVTFERLLAIRNPLTTMTRNRSIVRVAIVIFAISAIVCAQPLVCWHGGSEEMCDGRRVIYFYEQPSDAVWNFNCLVWEQVSAYCYIVIPVVLMFAFNAALIFYMQRHSSALLRFNSHRIQVRKKSSSTVVTRRLSKQRALYGSLTDTTTTMTTASGDDRSERGGCSTAGAIATIRPTVNNCHRIKPKKEMQSAVVVLALSLTSACMSLPSAVGASYYFVAWLLDSPPEEDPRSAYALFGEISNLVFLAEKNLAVFIYCITSSRFRRRLLAVLRFRREPRSSTTPAEGPFSNGMTDR